MLLLPRQRSSFSPTHCGTDPFARKWLTLASLICKVSVPSGHELPMVTNYPRGHKADGRVADFYTMVIVPSGKDRSGKDQPKVHCHMKMPGMWTPLKFQYLGRNKS